MRRKEQKECRTLLKAPLWQPRKGCSSQSLNVLVGESGWQKEMYSEVNRMRGFQRGASKWRKECWFGRREDEDETEEQNQVCEIETAFSYFNRSFYCNDENQTFHFSLIKWVKCCKLQIEEKKGMEESTAHITACREDVSTIMFFMYVLSGTKHIDNHCLC